jgi:RNA polymerase sigma-70 factor, ECF subfamily
MDVTRDRGVGAVSGNHSRFVGHRRQINVSRPRTSHPIEGSQDSDEKIANGISSGDVPWVMKANDAANIEDLLLHAGWLHRLAVALVKDQDAAEDIVQETLVTAWQRRGKSTGRPWLARVAKNLAIDRWRSVDRRQRRESTATAADTRQVASPEALLGDAQIHHAVAEAVAGLDEPFRQAIVLYYFDGTSSVDMARAMGIPEGTVRWRLKEGIERVRRQLDARPGQSRENWVAALLPLALCPPSAVPRGAHAHSRPRPSTRGPLGIRPTTVVSVAIFVGAIVLLVTAAASRHRGAGLSVSGASEDPASEHAAAPIRRTEGSVRLNPQLLTPSAEPETLPPGPGEADAESLVRELLDAIQAGIYHDFIAKGSPSFKAFPVDVFHAVSKDQGALLAAGYQLSFLGRLRQGRMLLWLFRVEFADNSDDALVFLTTDGWQVVRLHVDGGPAPNEKGE